MKTQREEIWTKRIEGLLFSLAMIGLLAVALSLGQWLAMRCGSVPTCQSDYPQAPRVDLSDLMLAAR